MVRFSYRLPHLCLHRS
uniref:Uncharacterized protein n=1 Tax=Arundo donax TaxID=35708 RepID=A0A0A9FJ05_ARUDO